MRLGTGRLPGGMWCAAMLAGAATLPCGTIIRACSHSVWGSILVSFIHPLLHQVRPLFCKSPTFSGDQPPTWTAHHSNQKRWKVPTLCLSWRPRWLCNPTAIPRSGRSSARMSRPQLTEAPTWTALCGSQAHPSGQSMHSTGCKMHTTCSDIHGMFDNT